MSSSSSHQISELLLRWGDGDPAALDNLLPLVYKELRILARFHINKERSGITWQGSDLVHETYLRLIQQHTLNWQNRKQFFAFAATIMRRLLVDHARQRRADKREGSRIKLPLDEITEISERNAIDVLVLDQIMNNLARLDPRQARIFELRCFGGLSVEETAEVLGLSPTTIKREWATARAWLQRAMRNKRNL